jgi:hypothetical protein
MALTDPDRKLLWGKAENRCAICGVALSRPPDAGDAEALIGEEAQIIGPRSSAARYEPLEPAISEGYGNRILLCPNHHTEVDRQTSEWTAERLLRPRLTTRCLWRPNRRSLGPHRGAGDVGPQSA